MHRREMEKIAVRCLLELEAMGYFVDVISDLDKVAEVIQPLRNEPGQAYDVDNLILSDANTFWFVVRRQLLPVLAFGVRVDDTGSESAQKYLRKTIQAVFGVKVTGSLHDIFADKHWGRAAYFGGFVGNSGEGKTLGHDSREVMELVAGYAHHCAFVDLKSDVNYSFHRMKQVGRAASYGYRRFDPFVWTTDRTMYEDGNPGWVMQLHKSDLPSLLAHSSRLFSHRLTQDDKDTLPVKIARAASA